MNDNEIEILRSFIKNSFPDAKDASGRKEIMIRCRECGDSVKDRNARHLYISLGYDNKPPMYNCFKCGAKGLLTPQKLIDWSVYDISINNEVVNILDKAASTEYKKQYNKIANIRNNFVTQSPLSDAKIKYINNRLGLNLGYQNILDKKIVPNLFDLLNSNNITTCTRDPRIMQELNNSFLGFLSADNTFITLRNLLPGKVSEYIDKRYVNYKIFNESNTSMRFYCIPFSFDLSVIYEPIRVHIAEGCFDILSVYYNLNRDQGNDIFCAACGNKYIDIMKFFIEYMKIINIEYHIYIDNDVSDYVIQSILYTFKYFGFNIFIHRNEMSNEKDFGVSRNRISESIYQIK